MEIQSPPNARSAKDVQDLYRRCCSDDLTDCNSAFQELGRFLLRIANSRVKSQPYLAPMTEDCVQKALVIVWQKLHSDNGPDRVEWFLTWCASIVIHLVLDELRKVRRSHADSLDELVENDEALLAQPAGPSPTPDNFTFETADDRAQFVALIQNHPYLSADAKLVLLHGYLLDLDDEELARQLGKSRTTVRVLRFRGLKTLRDDKAFMTKLMSLTFAEPVR
jgi:RNA polymerase sigma factor (sigma-70 family)